MKKKLLSILLICSMLLASLPLTVFAAESGSDTPLVTSVTYQQTEVKAETVANEDGYGSLRIAEEYDDDFNVTFPQTALIDAAGSFLFPYKETWLRYTCRDGVVSLISPGGTYTNYMTGTYEDIRPDMPGFYSLDGKPLFNSKYRNATPMGDGYAFVLEEKEDYGYNAYLINKAGQQVYSFPEEYGMTSWFGYGDIWEEGFSMMKTCGFPSEGLIGTGSLSDEYDYASFEFTGYLDMTGKLVLNGNGYADGYPFHEGLAKVKSTNGLYGFIDKTGAEVIPCQFDNAVEFCNGYCPALKDGKWGYINAKGETVIPFEYEFAYGAGDGLFVVGKDGFGGAVNKNGDVVVPFVYDDISSCNKGVIYAVKDGKIVIIKPQAELTVAFSDVSNADYFYDAVLWAVENGITLGTSTTTFSPDNSCSRGQAMTFLWRANGCPEPKGLTSSFSDVKADDYFYKAVLWAVENGITSGTSTTTFSPNDPCSNAHILTFIYRAVGEPGKSEAPATWYSDAVNWAESSDMISGTFTGTFSTTSNCCRANMVEYLYRYIAK